MFMFLLIRNKYTTFLLPVTYLNNNFNPSFSSFIPLYAVQLPLSLLDMEDMRRRGCHSINRINSCISIASTQQRNRRFLFSDVPFSLDVVLGHSSPLSDHDLSKWYRNDGAGDRPSITTLREKRSWKDNEIKHLRPVYTSEKNGTARIKSGTARINFYLKRYLARSSFTRSVKKRVHRRLWSFFGSERIKIGSVSTFFFLFQRVNARPLFGTDPRRFFLSL